MRSKDINIIAHEQIDLDVLKSLKIAVIGYGSQGRAQALNLKDSGFIPIIGLPPTSRSRKTVRQDGLVVTTPARAVQKSDLIAILIPDHLHKKLFEDQLEGSLRQGQTFVFAHALSVHFGHIKQPAGIDFVLVAPHGPGERLREKFLSGEGILAFVAKTEKSSKRSLKVAAAYAKIIGCSRAGLIVTGFAQEAVGDIFGEQAVLCGGLAALLKAGFDTLVQAGIPPHNAYVECVYQLDLIVDLIKKYGIGGMYEKISTTAEYGSYLAKDKIINAASKKAMKALLEEIASGRFVDKLMSQDKDSLKKLWHRQNENLSHSLDEMARFFYTRFGA